jgi:hypothetical protein
MDNKVNQIPGNYFNFKGIPSQQLLFFVLFAALLFPVFLFDRFFYFLLVGIVCVAWLYATGKNPLHTLELLKLPKSWDYLSANYRLNKANIPCADYPARSFRVCKNGEKVFFSEMAHKEFMTFFSFDEHPIPAGAYVSKRKDEVKFTFGWSFTGHDAYIDSDKMKLCLQRRLNGINGASKSLSFRVEQSSFLNDCGAISYIESLSSLEGITVIEAALHESERRRLCQMSEKPYGDDDLNFDYQKKFRRRGSGNLQNHQSYLYVKIKLRLGQQYHEEPTRLGAILSTIASIAGVGLMDPDVPDWDNAATQAYSIFTLCNDIVRGQKSFGLKAKVLTKEDFWALDYKEYRVEEEFLPDVPQWVPVTSEGIQFPEIKNEKHILGVLNIPENGLTPVVQAQRSYVKIPTTGKYAGYVRIGAASKIKQFPEIDGDKYKGMYLWLNQILDGLYDYKVIWEYYPDPTDIEAINIDRTLRGTIADQAHAMARKTINVQAQLLQEEAVDAAAKIAQNHTLGYVTMGIWVYRDSPEELFSDMESLVLRMSSAHPKILHQSCDEIWNQSKRYTWDQLDTAASDRRIPYFTSEAIIQMPAISPQPLDKHGVLFLHEQARTPVYYDYTFKSPNHFALVGSTGSSKSNILLSILMEGCNRRNPQMLFEFPRDDGTSTFTEIMGILRAQGKNVAYINVRRNKVNCLEKISYAWIRQLIALVEKDLSECPYGDRRNNLEFELNELNEKLISAIEDTVENHLEILVAVALGPYPNADTVETANSILRKIYQAFMADPVISAAYDKAIAAGFGNPGYETMPSLPTFVAFAKIWCDKEIETNKTLYTSSRTAIDLVLGNLEGVLTTPLGRSISGPSSFDLSNSDFIVLSLTNVKADRDSLVYTLIGMQLVSQKAMRSRRSGFICEECTTLYELPPLAKKVSTCPPRYRKQGTQCGFLFQTVGNVFSTPYGEQIFANLQKKFILKLDKGLLKEVVQHLNFPKDIAEQYIGETIDRSTLTSRLCVMENGVVIPLVHCPGEVHVAIAATDPLEEAARKRCRAKYGNPSDLGDIRWLIIFSRMYSDAIRSGAAMDTICPTGSGWDDIKERDLVGVK